MPFGVNPGSPDCPRVPAASSALAVSGGGIAAGGRVLFLYGPGRGWGRGLDARTVPCAIGGCFAGSD